MRISALPKPLAATTLLLTLGLGTLVDAQASMITFSHGGGESILVNDGGAFSVVPLTVEAWFFVAPLTPQSPSPYALGGHLFGKGNQTYSYGVEIAGPQGATISAGVLSPALPSAVAHIFTGVYQPATWHHVALTITSDTARLYVDGELEGTVSVSQPLPVNSVDPFQIGWLHGSIDEVRVWSVARTQAEIQSTMHRRLDGQPGLLSAFHLDGNLLDWTGSHGGSLTASGSSFEPSSAPVGPKLVMPSSTPIWSPITMDISLCAPTSWYILEASAAGTVPGIPIPAQFFGGTFPLNPPLLYSTYGGIYPQIFSGFLGSTDPSGAAVAAIALPPEPSLIGLQVSAALVNFDASQPQQFGGVSAARTTTITDFPPVALTAVTPVVGPSGGLVTVTGTGFTPTTTLDVSGIAVSPLSVSPTQLTFARPAAVPCDATLTVTASPSSSATIGFNPSPVINSTASASGPASGGQTMFLFGQHFLFGTAVTIGGAPAPIAFSQPTLLAVTVPPGSPGSASVVVTSPNGCTASTQYLYL